MPRPSERWGTARAADTEPVGVLEDVRVAVGDADQDGDVVARADLEAVHRAVGAGAPERRLPRGIEAQLFHGRRHKVRVLPEPGVLAAAKKRG